MEHIITDANFNEEVINSDIPVLVDFFANWCGPCKMMMPVVEELANEYDGRIKVGKVNVDEESATAMQYKVMSIPMFALFKNGQMIDSVLGAVPKTQLKGMMDRALN